MSQTLTIEVPADLTDTGIEGSFTWEVEITDLHVWHEDGERCCEFEWEVNDSEFDRLEEIITSDGYFTTEATEITAEQYESLANYMDTSEAATQVLREGGFIND